MNENNIVTTTGKSMPSTLVCYSGRKRGAIAGGKRNNAESLDDWYDTYHLFRSDQCKRTKASLFLRLSQSGKKFAGTKSEHTSFSKKLRLYDKGKLRRGQLKRQRYRKFQVVQDKLIKCIKHRERMYKIDKCALSWVISDALRNAGKVGANIHGEANDMTAEERDAIMKHWVEELHKLLEKGNIPMSCVDNAD